MVRPERGASMKRKLLRRRLLVGVLAAAALTAGTIFFVEKENERKVYELIDNIQIVYQPAPPENMYRHDPDVDIAKKISDTAGIKQLWDIHTSLKLEDYNKPLSCPRYVVYFMSGDTVLERWYLNDEITSGTRVGGNQRLKDPSVYDAVQGIWENAERVELNPKVLRPLVELD